MAGLLRADRAQRAHRAHLMALATAAAALMLGGCSSWVAPQTSGSFLGFITPYRMDIVQGNVVTREQVAVVKPGMTRTQVRDILGSPMLADMFHADRWDYVFTIVRQGTTPQRRSVVAWFKGDKLDHVDAPDLPSEQEFVAAITRGGNSDKPVPALELTPEQRQALPRPPKVEAEAAAPVGAVLRAYPPLEPS